MKKLFALMCGITFTLSLCMEEPKTNEDNWSKFSNDPDTKRIVELQKKTLPLQNERLKLQAYIAKTKKPLSEETKAAFHFRNDMIKHYLAKVWTQLSHVHSVSADHREKHFATAQEYLKNAKKELLEYKSIFKDNTLIDIDQEPEPQTQAKL